MTKRVRGVLRRRQPFFRPRVEPLEGRCVPAVFTVNSNLVNLDVDGKVTLLEAIQAANTNAPAGDAPAGDLTSVAVDVIRFAPSLSGPVIITLGGTPLSITEDLTINGPGVASFPTSFIAINGNSLSRIFNVDNFAPTTINVAINGLILFGGKVAGGDGGGISNRENLSVADSLITSNETDLSGGSIANLAGATLTIASSTISDSKANFGGAVANSGTLILRDSAVTDNTATTQGGGIFNGGTLTVDDSSLSGNTATNEHGGGLANTGDATVNNSVIGGNSAGIGGGGIHNNADGHTLSVRDSTISGNACGNGGGGVNNFGGDVTLINCTVAGNSAGAGAGGVRHNEPGTLTLLNTTVSGNTGSDGGGISTNGSTTIKNSTISGNSATRDGGGIWDNRSMTLANSTVVGNTAGGNGGGVFLFPGGGLANLTSTIVANNDAAGYGDDLGSGGPTYRFLLAFSLVKKTAGASLSETTPGSNLYGVDPLLGPLANNGGPTLTHALMLGSPALDRGSSPEGPANDQRGFGFDRVIGAAADVGAFESRDPDVRVVPDPQNRGKKVLVIVGTRRNDRITVRPDGDALEVEFDGDFHTFDRAGVTRLVAFGLEGNDRVEVSARLTLSSLLDGGRGADVLLGGAGPDTIRGQAGNDLILGRGGNDRLEGGAGRDFLIGGAGRDVLAGGADDDLLVGGATVYDNRQSALTQILAVWASAESYATRASRIRNGARVPRLSASQIIDRFFDQLIGDIGRELFFSNKGDAVQNKTKGEQGVIVR